VEALACVAVAANVSSWQPSFGLSNNLATLGGIPTAFALYDAHDNGWALDAGPSDPPHPTWSKHRNLR
jgi:hypothetical protein